MNNFHSSKVKMSGVVDISLEGLIGVGKSTMVKQIEQSGITVYEEPLNLWSAVPYTDPITGIKKTVNVFENYCRDPVKYSASFQTFTFQTRRMGSVRPAKCIRERSIVGDMMFGTANYLMGNMDEVQFACYSFIAEDELKRHDNPTAYVYVYSPIDTCMERIRLRHRSGESSINEKYMTTLQSVHNSYFLRNIGKKHYIVDGSHDIGSVEYQHTLNDLLSAFDGDFSGLEKQTESLVSKLK